jgi:hypothetical protein
MKHLDVTRKINRKGKMHKEGINDLHTSERMLWFCLVFKSIETPAKEKLFYKNVIGFSQ